ncbi:MAG: sigma-70 family RNA polymerase sigma factor, partial [Bacteroidota bacterium]
KISEKVYKEIQIIIETDMLYQPNLYVESELQSRIKSAFEKLPPRINEVFTLSRFKGYSNDEIAGQLNISKRTVETQISNALKILREELKDYMFMLLLF